MKIFLNKLLAFFRKFRKPKFTKEQKLGMMLEDLSLLFGAIDDLVSHKLSRTARKQFWRDFCKNRLIRKDIFDELLKSKRISNKLLDEYVSLKGVR